jgi:hypothetical protein
VTDYLALNVAGDWHSEHAGRRRNRAPEGADDIANLIAQ